MSNKKEQKPLNKKAIIIVIAAIIIIIGIIAILFVTGTFSKENTENKVGENDYDVNGKYLMAVANGDNAATEWSMVFNSEDGTYEQTLTVGEISADLSSGTYEVDKDNSSVTCTPVSDDADGQTTETVQQVFTIYGEYLLAEGYYYEGDEVTGSSLKGDYTYTDADGNTKVITFAEDGTFTKTESSQTLNGTYTVNGDFVDMTPEDGSEWVDFLIYNNKLCNAYYKKQTLTSN